MSRKFELAVFSLQEQKQRACVNKSGTQTSTNVN